MMELMSDLPDHVVGIVASGEVTARDYETVLMPAVEDRLGRHGKLRFIYRLDPAFTGFTAGAMWDDAKLGVAHFSAWERIAVVTDVDWIAGAARLFGFAMPCPVRVFPLAQVADAMRWIVA
jgi:SpoIIAA-like